MWLLLANATTHAQTGDPDRDLQQNMARFGYVLRKFGGLRAQEEGWVEGWCRWRRGGC
jgi:hypothetical protein